MPQQERFTLNEVEDQRPQIHIRCPQVTLCMFLQRGQELVTRNDMWLTSSESPYEDKYAIAYVVPDVYSHGVADTVARITQLQDFKRAPRLIGSVVEVSIDSSDVVYDQILLYVAPMHQIALCPEKAVEVQQVVCEPRFMQYLREGRGFELEIPTAKHNAGNHLSATALRGGTGSLFPSGVEAAIAS